jgi:adenylate cyclase
MKTIELVRDVECRSTPADLWRAVSDTERLNRAAGMAPVEVKPVDGPGSARVEVRTRLDGLPVTFDEEPFEWHTPSAFTVRRNMKEGALHALTMGMEILPLASGGSRVRWSLRFTVKIALLAPIVKLLGQRRMMTIVAATRAFDDALGAEPPAAPAGAVGDAVRRAVTTMHAALPEVDAAVVERLGAWVAGAPDDDVRRIRPYELADRWNIDRDVMLTTCLEGVVAGLLQMYWDIVCPSCRTGASRVDHLYDLPTTGHCSFCDISFDLPLDQAVEAVFQPAAPLRAVEHRTYCTGGPAATPHVVTQVHLPADGEARFVGPTAAGRYRLFVRGGAVADVTVAPDGAADAAFQAGTTLEPAAARIAPGATVRVRQTGGTARHVKLEHAEWLDRAATAHTLSLAPRFRRIFSGEVLGPGRQLHVARVALLFSDLSASTALYSRVGDAPAFRLVQDHFELLRGHIAAEGGVVVKTIGDAVMAAFPDERRALRAAVAMQATWDGFRDGRDAATDTMLKIGVHAGPAYVVTANGVLDYFGQTVNVAARLQGAAHEREIVVTGDLADRASEAGWLGSARVVERFDAVLKGLDRPLRAARLAVG